MELQRALPADQRTALPAAAIIRHKLDWEAQSAVPEKAEFYAPLRAAWDALAYEEYGFASSDQQSATAALFYYYSQHRATQTAEPESVRLTNPAQTRMLDALAEAAQAPHQRGQTAVEIPEKLKSPSQWLLSDEYQTRLKAEAARKRGDPPEEPHQRGRIGSTAKPEQGSGHTGHTENTNLLTEQDPFYQAFWEQFIDKAITVPLGENPAFWPRRLFEKIEYDLANRDFLTDKARFDLASKLAPLQERIRRIRIAYEIAAYPVVQKRSWEKKLGAWQRLIADDLEMDRELRGRDAVTLDGAEQEIVRKLCLTPRYSLDERGRRTREPHIPFDETRRVYRYADILTSSREGEGST